ncbi:tubulin-like doman-containing protein [Limnoglobus roseus]|uniref:tubulin-like doman-containing protein n=1 Tax=Limnoglobus roseus TaxID=2598579 RepID=UPI0011EAC51C|nr:tubulin-like doman-containing protein [Limnoglobus roseus]
MIGLREPGDEVLAGYQLIAPIGSGGFGEVWKCSAPGGLHKAIKFVFGNLNSLDGDAVKAEQELKALGRMKEVRHPFVISIERIDNQSGELLILMELADKSLHDAFVVYQTAGRSGIPRDLLLGYLADAAEGLDFLNEKHNLQHLDVKPKNLFLVGDRVKVADFGLVKHLERHSSSGLMGGVTPVYAAPETFTNKISKHSDQYSLAIVYLELLTGGKPFGGKNIRQLALQHMTEPPDLSSLLPDDRPIVARALSKNPDDRFPSCAAFVHALIANSEAAVLRTPRPVGGGPTPRPGPGVETPPPKADDESMTVTRLDVGVLRPAVLIGVGSFGRRAIQQVRCRLLDRLGDLNQIPSFRFLYLDTDPDTTGKLGGDKTDAAIQPEQVVHLPLQPVTNYRRKHLDPILEWMPREKLYAMPRSLATEGSRALGRLAFCDNFLKVGTRLRIEIQTAIHPEAVKQSADQTGLLPREKVPTVYVFASATGGGSGFLLDLGHTIRRALAKFNMADAPVTAFVFCGAPEDPRSPAAELANVYATLTELNHYADPDVPFSAQYGGDGGPKMEARGLPFTATYLLPMAHRTQENFRDCVTHLAGYITHDLTTPLGSGLEDIRSRKPAPGRTPFRGFGTFGVWFPRGLLLRSAARQLCTTLLKNWSAHHRDRLPVPAQRLIDDIFNDPRLMPADIQKFIVQESRSGPTGSPTEVVTAWLASLTEQVDPVAKQNDGAAWSAVAWEQARELIGLEPTSDTDSPYRRGRLSRMLDSGIRNARRAWENELTELVRPLGEIHGPRLYALSTTLERVMGAMNSAAIVAEQQAAAMVDRREKSLTAVKAAYETCQAGGGGFKLFGGPARQLRHFLDALKQFFDLRTAEDLTHATARFYRKLASKLDDRWRNVQMARDQLDAMLRQADAPPAPAPGSRFGLTGLALTPDVPDESVQATLSLTNTMRVVLPNGDDQLDHAAADMLRGVPGDEIMRLYDILDKLVIEPRGGLVDLCRTNSDLYRGLCVPMIEQTAAFLAYIVPTQDVSQVELTSQEAKKGPLVQRIGHYLKLACPQAPGPAEEEKTYVLVPATAPGATFAREVKKVAPKAVIVSVQGQGTDLLFCREQGHLRAADLMKLIEPCWDAYSEAAATVEQSPHSRFDVQQWVPLETR